jgi:hypothetical protein
MRPDATTAGGSKTGARSDIFLVDPRGTPTVERAFVGGSARNEQRVRRPRDDRTRRRPVGVVSRVDALRRRKGPST